MNYSEINPKLSYNKTSSNDSSNDFCAYDNSPSNMEELPAFKMFQDSIGNPLNNKFGSYYCNGPSSAPKGKTNGTLSSLAMKDVAYDTEVSKMYFSTDNIRRLQKKIKTEVTRLSKGNFNLDVDQDENDMLIAMRAIYLDNSKNLPTHVVQQVKALNQFFLQNIVPDMMTNIKQQYDYIKDISNPIKPPPQPLNVSRAGRKALPSTTTIWGFNR
jgi:hypothetical protein